MPAIPAPAAVRNSRFERQVLAGVVAGVLLGLLVRADGPQPASGHAALGLALDTVGSAFVSLLKALVPPLVFTAVVASIANLRSLEGAAGLAWRTLLWFAITAAIAVAIGLALDMGRTAVNVAGQALVPVIVAKRQGILDLDRFAAPAAVGLPEPA